MNSRSTVRQQESIFARKHRLLRRPSRTGGCTQISEQPVQHLREFRTSTAALDTKLAILYDDPGKAGGLSENRVLVLLRELELLLAAAWLFALASLMAVGSSILGERQSELAALSTWVTIAVDGVGLALLLGASVGFRSECVCARQLIHLHSRTGLEDER